MKGYRARTIFTVNLFWRSPKNKSSWQRRHGRQAPVSMWMPNGDNGREPDLSFGAKSAGETAPGRSKQPLYPDEAQVEVYVILAEALYHAWVG